jgi:hypothetical protein
MELSGRRSSKTALRPETIGRWYVLIATQVCSALLLIVAVNGIIWLYLLLKQASAPQLPARFQRLQSVYGDTRVTELYPGWTDRDLSAYSAELNRFRYVYDPALMGFRTASMAGRYINVAPDGFRLVADQGPWPPQAGNINVFVFGGSTAWGWWVADDQTIASYLQQELNRGAPPTPIYVYNFGQPGYVGRQERHLFESLLGNGVMPDWIIFLDGINDATGSSMLAQSVQVQRLYDRVSQHSGALFGATDLLLDYWASLPIGRAGTYFVRRLGPAGPAIKPDDPADIVNQWMINKTLTERLLQGSATQSLFIWQPAPWYQYDLQFHMFRKEFEEDGPDILQMQRDVYTLMAEQARSLKLGSNMLWLADLQAGRQENFYADTVHYTATFSQEIAFRISQFLRAHDSRLRAGKEQ